MSSSWPMLLTTVEHKAYTASDVRSIAQKVYAEEIPEKAPGETLRAYITKFMVRTPHAPDGFLPGGELMLTRLLRQEYIVDELSARFPYRDNIHLVRAAAKIRGHGTSPSRVFGNASMTFKSVFAVLLMCDLMQFLFAFLDESSGIEDAALPLVPHRSSDGSFSLHKSGFPGFLMPATAHIAQAHCVRMLEDDEKRRFERVQWRLHAPIFADFNSRDEYKGMLTFPDIRGAPLPFFVQHPSSPTLADTEIAFPVKDKDGGLHGLVGTIRQVQVHPLHEDFSSRISEFAKEYTDLKTAVIVFRPDSDLDYFYFDEENLYKLFQAFANSELRPVPPGRRILNVWRQGDRVAVLYMFGFIPREVPAEGSQVLLD